MRKAVLLLVLLSVLIFSTGCSNNEVNKLKTENDSYIKQVNNLKIENGILKNKVTELEKSNKEKDKLLLSLKEVRETQYKKNNELGQASVSNAKTEDSSTSEIAVSSIPSSDVIESKIDGDFEGWDGETIFKLANGQIWQQVSYSYTYHYSYRPDVVIYKSGGSYKLKVEDVDKTITVRRIK